MAIPGSSFFNWESGAIKDAAEEALRRHGGSYSSALQDIQIGGLENAYGANPENVREYLINKQRNAINNDPQMQALATASDAPIYESGGFANQGESLQAVSARLKKLRDTKAEAEETKKLEVAKGIRQEGYKHANDTLAATLAAQTQQTNAQLKSQQDQFAFERGERASERTFNRKENDLNRRQERELADSNSSLQMQMAIMNNDLAEKRMDYDRETRRMDKRSAAIAQLMSGLGSLGGAFSL